MFRLAAESAASLQNVAALILRFITQAKGSVSRLRAWHPHSSRLPAVQNASIRSNVSLNSSAYFQSINANHLLVISSSHLRLEDFDITPIVTMMHLQRTLFISCLFAAYAVNANCLHGTSLLRREEGKVKVSDFGYTGLQGPLNWAGLSEKNSACASSSIQSPINIDKSIELAKVAPKITIESVEEAEFENLGSTVEVIVNGTTVVGDKDFRLKQFHFHTPSEHRINEEYYPLEMHMVHEAAGTF